MICHYCNNRDRCDKLCDRVISVLYSKNTVCANDIGVYCVAGDPNGLYHPECDDMVCKHYKTNPNIKRDVQFIRAYKEFSFPNEFIDRMVSSDGADQYMPSCVVDSNGYTQLAPYQLDLTVPRVGILFRRYVQRLLIDNPLRLTTHQARALRLYFSLITRQDNSLLDVACVMGISKMRIVQHIYAALIKIKTYIIYTIVGGMMNGSACRFEEIGIKIDIVRPMCFDTEAYAKIKSILTTKCSSEILTRDQFQSLWLFCGCGGETMYSVDEIAELIDVSRDIVIKRINTGVKRLNKYIIDKILDTGETLICAARDCTNSFVKTHDKKIYCSSICRDRERERRYRDKKREEKDQVKCKGCGIMFTPEHVRDHYHNPRCAARHKWENCTHSKKQHVIETVESRKKVANGG